MPTDKALVMDSMYCWSAASVSGPKYVPNPSDDTVRSPPHASFCVGSGLKWPFPAHIEIQSNLTNVNPQESGNLKQKHIRTLC
jgi:hypothetical protein